MIQSRPARKIAAFVSLSLTLVFLVLLIVLHFLKPELDPSWRMISEYEIGQYGWLMQLAFFSLAIAIIALFVALRPHIRSLGGYVGLGLLLIGAVGVILGGSFVTDPITTQQADWSTAGTLHNIGGALLILPMPVFMVLINRSLTRHNSAWKGARHWLLWPTLLVWLSVVAFYTIAASGGKGGGPGPDVVMGWPNRAFMLGFCLWIMVVAWLGPDRK